GVNASFDVGAAGHGDAERSDAAALAGGGGDIEQMPGIAGAVAGRTDDGVGKRGELSRQPPSERMKPVQATIDFGKQRHGAVEPLNVHLLVSQDGAAL